MAPAKRSSSRKPRQTKTKRELSQLQSRSMLMGHSNSEDVIVGGRTKKQRSERPAKEAQRLNAVNGKVVPSTLGPGERPQQGEWTEDNTTVYACSICGMKFKRKYNVKSHMPACVKRNGNPNGLKWDDAWKKTISQDNNNHNNNHHDNDHDEDEEAARVSEEGDSQNQTEERDLPELPPSTPLGDYSITGNSPVDLPSASSSPVSPSPLPSSSVPSSFPSLRRRPTPPTPGPQPHESQSMGTFGHLSNEELLGMVYHLDYRHFHQYQGQRNMRPHPQLDKVMKELEARGIAREQRSWMLDFEGEAVQFRMV